jgi:formylglycine-generating enzyme required for sulfatase activity
MGKTEVTQGQWKALMGSNPSKFSSCGTNCPVEQVSWWDALKFANKASAAEGLAACYSISVLLIGEYF